MKTFTESEILDVVRGIHALYKNNNDVTQKLMDYKNSIIAGSVRDISIADFVTLLESHLGLCEIIHKFAAQTERTVLDFAPSLIFADKAIQKS